MNSDLKGTISEAVDEDEEILGSDDDEQEDPRDYTKGLLFVNAVVIDTTVVIDSCYLFAMAPASRWLSFCQDWRSVS